MSSAVLQLIVLAAIAVFLVLRLRSVLGTREGFERPAERKADTDQASSRKRRDFEVIEGGVDPDIADHTDPKGDSGKALAAMTRAEPDFNVSEFLGGAGAAYEMILMAFENGELEPVQPYLSSDVFDGFKAAVDARTKSGLKVEATFVGLRENRFADARFDDKTGEAELTVAFVAEVTSAAYDKEGKLVEGDANAVKKQSDTWTFGRAMGVDDPNWQLVATG